MSAGDFWCSVHGWGPCPTNPCRDSTPHTTTFPLRVSTERYRPHVTTEHGGARALEWWNGDKKLTVYVDDGVDDIICSDERDRTYEEAWRWIWE